MIHFTCDLCHRSIESDNELRYVVRMEVYAAIDAAGEEVDGDVDHLEEIDEILERMDDLDDEELDGEVYQQVRYDLCADCRRQFAKDPLSRMTPAKLGFSEN